MMAQRPTHYSEPSLDKRLVKLRGTADSGRSSVLWTVGLRVAVQLFQFSAVLVLARLLSPAQYGLATIVFAITGAVFFVNDFGVTSTLIATRELKQGHVSAAYLINTVAGIAIFVSLYTLASPISRAFGQPELSGLLKLSGLAFLLSLSAVPMGLLLRVGRIRAIGLIELAGAGVNFVSSCVLAALGLGAAALVFGAIASSVVVSTVALTVVRVGPRKELQRGVLKTMASTSVQVMVFEVLNYASINVDRLIIARFQPISQVGQYGRGASIAAIPSSILALGFSRTFYPTFARLGLRSEESKKLVRQSILTASLVSFPVAIVISLNAPLILDLLLGDRWDGAAAVLQVLAGTIPLLVLRSLTAPVLQTLGGTGRQMVLGAVAFLVTAGGTIAFANGGIVAGAGGYLLGSLVATATAVVTASRALRLQLSTWLVCSLPGIGVALIVLGVHRFLQHANVDSISRLACDSALLLLSALYWRQKRIRIK